MADLPQEKGRSISMTYKRTTGKYYFLWFYILKIFNGKSWRDLMKLWLMYNENLFKTLGSLRLYPVSSIIIQTKIMLKLITSLIISLVF
jgi:hypothetical protein